MLTPLAYLIATKVAVLPLEIDGELPGRWEEVISQRLVQGMSQAGLEVVPPNEHGVNTCGDSACFQDLGESTGADYIIQATLVFEKERRKYDLTVRIVSASSGNEVASSNDSCDLCGFEEGADLVEAKAGAVSDRLDKLAVGRPTATFTTEPAGAELEIDGRAAGKTPLSVELDPGTHRVQARLEGFMPHTIQFKSVEGINQELEFTMVPAPQAPADTKPPEPTTTKPPEGQGMIIAGAVLVGAGVAAVAAGGVLLAVHGQPYRRNCEADEDGNCRFLYGTDTGGTVSLALGGAALITGAGLIVGGKLRQRRARMKARAALTPTGLSLYF